MAMVILQPLCVFSQNTIYKEVYNLNTKYAPDKLTPSSSIMAYHDGFVFSIAKFNCIEKDFLVIKQYNIKKQNLSLIKIKKTKENKKLFSESIFSFAVTENKLVIITGYNIFIFDKKNDDLQLKKVLKNKQSFTRVFRLNSKNLLLYVNYNFHPLDSPDIHVWAKLNLDGDSIYSVKKMGDESKQFTYFVNEWISTYKGLIAYAHTTDYTIRLYNQNFEQVDSIKSDLMNVNLPLLKYISSGDEHSSDEMTAIRKADDTLLTRIEKTFLLDSTSLLAIIKLPKTNYLRFDLWKKINTKWSITKTNTLPSYYQKGGAYNEKNNELTGFFGNYDGLIYAGNFDFYFFYFPFIENITTKSFNFEEDYNDKINKLTREKQIYYGIKKIKILHD